MLRAIRGLVVCTLLVLLLQNVCWAQRVGLKIQDISGGEYHSLALAKDGSLWACGGNVYGQLGVGNINPVNTLQHVLAGAMGGTYLQNITDFDAGLKHSLSLDSNHNVFAWGSDEEGELGNGPGRYDLLVPGRVLGGEMGTQYLQNIVTLSAGRSGKHSLAVDTAGHVWAWGFNESGQCGNGNQTNQSTPVKVLKDGGGYLGDGNDTSYQIIKVEAGQFHSLALDRGGRIWRWGDQIGWEAKHLVITDHPTLKFAAIAALANSTALDENGNVWKWVGGWGAPQKVAGGEMGTEYLQNIVAIGKGTSHGLALDSSGNVWAWEDNWWGQLGIDDELSFGDPVKVHDGQMYTERGFLDGIATIDAGYNHSLAVDSHGIGWGWGAETDGQLGNGVSGSGLKALSPVMISPAGPAALSITKMAQYSGASVSPGSAITYTVSYANTVTNTASADYVGPVTVTITDTLPRDVNFVSASNGGSYSAATRTVTWPAINPLNPGSSGSYTLNVVVNRYAAPGGYIRNVARMENDLYVGESRTATPVQCYGGSPIYVRQGAPWGGNGTSWALAYNDLQDALARAGSGCGATTIWVAKGTYIPGPYASSVFTIPSGVSIYGGFAGAESANFSVDARDLRNNVTILSGNGVKGNVVAMQSNSVVDGCVIEQTTMNAVEMAGSGASLSRSHIRHNSQTGINITCSSASIDRCTVEENGYFGVNLASGGSAALTGTIIRDNQQHGIRAGSSTLTMKSCVVSRNGLASALDVRYYGIDLNMSGSSVATISNCTIVYNIDKGVNYVGTATINVVNSILWYNNAGLLSGEQTNGIGAANMTYSCMPYSSVSGGTGNITTQPDFVSNDPNLGAHFHLKFNSPCKDNGASGTYSTEHDIDYDARKVGTRVDIGADEVACENAWNEKDFNGDGVVDVLDLDILCDAWLAVDVNDSDWNPRVNLIVDGVIDFRDFSAFAAEWGAKACWYTGTSLRFQGPSQMPEYDPNQSFDPNVPFDPNEMTDPNMPTDPNDPNGFGMMGMQFSLEQSSMVMDSGAAGGSLTAQQIEGMVAFLYQAAQDDPDSAAMIYEFIPKLEQELQSLPSSTPADQ